MFFSLFQLETLTLRANAASGYSEQRTVRLSSFAAIPAVHHCHQLVIDQRLMQLMFTAAHLSLYPHHSAWHWACTPSQREDLRGRFPVTAHQACVGIFIFSTHKRLQKKKKWPMNQLCFVWTHWCTDKTFVWFSQAPDSTSSAPTAALNDFCKLVFIKTTWKIMLVHPAIWWWWWHQ